MKKIVIVTPTYNEEENIINFIAEIEKIMLSISVDYDHLIIDNASTDKTQILLRDIAQNKKNLKLIFNLKNFGWSRSSYHALMESLCLVDNINCKSSVLLISADFQEPITLIPEFIKAWDNNYKIVLGKKISSDENLIKFNIRRLYYKLINQISEIKLTQNTVGFGLYDKNVLYDLKKIKDPSPYFRGLISELGYEIKLIDYHQPLRKFGVSKMNFFSLYDIAITGFVKHTKLPLRLITITSFIVSLISLLISFIYFIYKLLFWEKFALGIAPLVIGFFGLGFFQIFILGIIGEYILTILTHVRNIPYVFEKERINF